VPAGVSLNWVAGSGLLQLADLGPLLPPYSIAYAITLSPLLASIGYLLARVGADSRRHFTRAPRPA
jgi:hypothetical protein